MQQIWRTLFAKGFNRSNFALINQANVANAGLRSNSLLSSARAVHCTLKLVKPQDWRHSQQTFSWGIMQLFARTKTITIDSDSLLQCFCKRFGAFCNASRRMCYLQSKQILTFSACATHFDLSQARAMIFSREWMKMFGIMNEIEQCSLQMQLLLIGWKLLLANWFCVMQFFDRAKATTMFHFLIIGFCTPN